MLLKGKEVVDPRSHLVVKPPNLQEGLASQVGQMHIQIHRDCGSVHNTCEEG